MYGHCKFEPTFVAVGDEADFVAEANPFGRNYGDHAIDQGSEAAAERGEADDGPRYYHYWLAALERLVVTKGLSDPATLLDRKEAWADAYRHTPHGSPVELESDSSAR